MSNLTALVQVGVGQVTLLQGKSSRGSLFHLKALFRALNQS